MKKPILCAVWLAVVAGFGAGCANPRATYVRLSGPPNELFTLKYRANGLEGDITTTTRGREPSTVMAMDIPGREFDCEIFRPHREVELKAEFVQGGKAVYRATLPAGANGIKVTSGAGGWRQEPY